MKKVLAIILGILIIIAGGMYITTPGLFIVTAGIVLGITLFVNGLTHLCMYFEVKKTAKVSVWYLISAIISIIFGAVIMGSDALKLSASVAIIYVVAFWFIVSGIVRIATSFKIKDLGQSNWWAVLILGILLILLGIYCFGNPVFLFTFVGVLFGVNMIVCGVDLIAVAFATPA